MERYFSLVGIGEKPTHYPSAICYFWDGNAIPEHTLIEALESESDSFTLPQRVALNTQRDGRRFVITSNATMRDYCERMEELIPLWFDVL